MKTITICALIIPLTFAFCSSNSDVQPRRDYAATHRTTTGTGLTWAVPRDADESAADVVRLDDELIITITSDGWWGEETIQLIVDGGEHGYHEVAPGVVAGAMTSSGIYRCLSWELSGRQDAAIGNFELEDDGDEVRAWYDIDFAGHDHDGRMCSLSVRDGYLEAASR